MKVILGFLKSLPAQEPVSIRQVLLAKKRTPANALPANAPSSATRRKAGWRRPRTRAASAEDGVTVPGGNQLRPGRINVAVRVYPCRNVLAAGAGDLLMGGKSLSGIRGPRKNHARRGRWASALCPYNVDAAAGICGHRCRAGVRKVATFDGLRRKCRAAIRRPREIQDRVLPSRIPNQVDAAARIHGQLRGLLAVAYAALEILRGKRGPAIAGTVQIRVRLAPGRRGPQNMNVSWAIHGESGNPKQRPAGISHRAG